MDIERLIKRAKKGDEKALGDLYKAFAPKMKGVCHKILDNDKSMAEDLVHDAFILAFASIDKLNNPQRFGQWLTTITRNVTLKYIEKVRKNAYVPLSAISQKETQIAEEDIHTGTDISYEELLTAIESLPSGYRNVFKLSVIEGLSHQEIADMLGIEAHSSSSQLHRAKLLLRKMLLKHKSLTVIIIALISIPLLYKLLTNKEQKQTASKPVLKKEKDKIKETHKTEEYINEPIYVATENNTPITPPENTIRKEADSIFIAVVDTIISKDNQSEDVIIAETDLDSLQKDEIIPIKKSKKSNWEFLAASSLSTALAQNIYNNSDNITSDDKIIEKESHRQPITISLSLTKGLCNRWSVETGLQYSLLKSSFTSSNQDYNIKKYQKIHYIGIPLRVYYRFADYKNFSAYGAAGTTLNIPVSGNIERRYYVAGANSLTVPAEKWHINSPLQWSVNTSVGLQYKFTPNISLYIEPTLNYYIPTESSYHTIWTERPVTFSAPLGIRFTW